MAAISGGGDVNSGNNAATDITLVGRGLDLTITKSHTWGFIQGQIGATYTVTITNSAVGPTNGPVTVIDILPQGLNARAGRRAGAGLAARGVVPGTMPWRLEAVIHPLP